MLSHAHAAGFTPHHRRGVRSLARGSGCWAVHSCNVVYQWGCPACLGLLHERSSWCCVQHRRSADMCMAVGAAGHNAMSRVVRSSCCLSVVLHAVLSTSASVLLGVLGFMQSLSRFQLIFDLVSLRHTCCTIFIAWGCCVCAGCVKKSAVLLWCWFHPAFA